jgi:hypothetical protein
MAGETVAHELELPEEPAIRADGPEREFHKRDRLQGCAVPGIVSVRALRWEKIHDAHAGTLRAR